MFSLPNRKLISWKKRSPASRMILPIFWRRKRGLSSFWLPTNLSVKSPQSWPQTSLWPRSLLPTPASPLRCLPSYRAPRQPQSLPASQPSPQPQTRSSPAIALSSPLPPSPTARSRWQILRPPSWRSLWTCWRRRRWRRHGQCQRSTCPTPSTQLRTGSSSTTRPITLTLSPCAHPWWPAPLPAARIRLRLCSPSQRQRPSPLVASPTGEEAAATNSPLTPSAHQPCWPFKDSSSIIILPIKHMFFMYEMIVQTTGLWNGSKLLFYLPLSILAYYTNVASLKACFN